MKVLLIVNDYGSFNNFLAELSVKMVGAGHEVHVICSSVKVINYPDKYPFENMGIHFHIVQFPRSYNLYKQLAASKLINTYILKIDPHLIHVHFTSSIFTTLLWCKPPYPVLGTIHGIGFLNISGQLKRKIFEVVERFCFKRLDRIYLINRNDYDLVKKIHPQKAFKHNSCGLGCNISKFDPGNLPANFKVNFRKELGIKPDEFVIVYTGRFVDFKGFNIVIKTMMALLKDETCPDVRLMLIGGDDPIHESGLTASEIAFYKENPQVTLIGFTADVNRYLGIADLFLFPSVKEGMPVSIMEALAMGVPVITSNSRGCNELVIDQVNGILLSNTPAVDETKNAVMQLYRNRALLKKLSSNALNMRPRLSRDSYVDEQIAIYETMHVA